MTAAGWVILAWLVGCSMGACIGLLAAGLCRRAADRDRHLRRRLMGDPPLGGC
jgi:predicted acylesterase/phospholipase RssA